MCEIEERISALLEYLQADLYMPEVRVADIIEVFILSFFIYKLIEWVRNTKAWMLMKGIVVLAGFILVSAVFQMHTILFLARNSVTILATVAVVVFQPELRRALEKLGERQFLFSMVPYYSKKEEYRFHSSTRDALVDACFAMGMEKTGALIVVEKATRLTEYESTGIYMDCVVSQQVLLNIFEHNTPLHDGAIIVRGDRIVAATCYLPLSDNMFISKSLGTRHRAALGMSEISDALVIVVSEETGRVSVAEEGGLERGVDKEELRTILRRIQMVSVNNGRFRLWKRGKRQSEGSVDEKH